MAKCSAGSAGKRSCWTMLATCQDGPRRNEPRSLLAASACGKADLLDASKNVLSIQFELWDLKSRLMAILACCIFGSDLVCPSMVTCSMDKPGCCSRMTPPLGFRHNVKKWNCLAVVGGELCPSTSVGRHIPCCPYHLPRRASLHPGRTFQVGGRHAMARPASSPHPSRRPWTATGQVTAHPSAREFSSWGIPSKNSDISDRVPKPLPHKRLRLRGRHSSASRLATRH